MRILFDARAVQDRADGLSNYVRHTLTHLLRLDADNEYVILLGPALRDHLASVGLLERRNVRPVITSILFMSPYQQVSVPLLARHLPHASLFHYPHFDLPVLVHPRSLVTIHDLNHITFRDYFDSLRRVKRSYSAWATRLTVAKARHIITVSDTTKRELLRRFRWLDPEHVSVIGSGLNSAFQSSVDPDRIEAFRRKFHLGGDRYILYVGTHRAHKNLDRLFEAYGKLRRQSSFTHKLLLVGSSKAKEKLEQTIAAYGLNGSVLPLGYVAEEELPLAYRVADAFVFCSLSEGFGMPLLEAMASGLPIVTSNVGAMAEIAADSAVLVDPLSAEAIAEGLTRVLSCAGLRHDLIERGQRRVRTFTWEEAARKTLQVYEMVSKE